MADMMTSAFYTDTMRLDVEDIAKLIVTGTLKVGNILIGYEHLPDNGCPCENCRSRATSQPDA